MALEEINQDYKILSNYSLELIIEDTVQDSSHSQCIHRVYVTGTQ